MLPDSVLSTRPVLGELLPPRTLERLRLEAYEQGGANINDPSQGLQVQTWRGRVIGSDVVLDSESVAPIAFLTVSGIEEFDFTFDQSMNPFIAYERASGCSFYWYDTSISAYTTTDLPAGSVSPRCALDDKRALQSGSSDIVLAYMRDTTLYARLQRDRYLVEYALRTGIAGRLHQIGMSTVWRMQFHISVADAQ